MRLARSESLILPLLAARGEAYGLELVAASRGRLKRGGVYVTLGRMERKGLVRSAPAAGGRRVYRPTALGARAHLAARVFSGRVRLPSSA
jgi:DNA-binding PadR family transcriptional regulator